MSLIVPPNSDAHLLPLSDVTPSNPLAPLSIVKIIKISSVTPWSQALSDEGWGFHHDITPVLIIPVIQLSSLSPTS